MKYCEASSSSSGFAAVSLCGEWRRMDERVRCYGSNSCALSLHQAPLSSPRPLPHLEDGDGLVVEAAFSEAAGEGGDSAIVEIGGLRLLHDAPRLICLVLADQCEGLEHLGREGGKGSV